MLTKKIDDSRKQVEFNSLENLVPSDHLLRKVDKAINFDFIYDEVKHLYSEVGRPSVDPVVLIKIVLIQYLFGIPSMRQTIAEIQINIAYRWFMGYSISEPIPHFSTFSKNYSRRFKDSNIFSTCDDHNFILGFSVTPGNVHDSTVFDDVYLDIYERCGNEMTAVAVDTGYKTPYIAKTVLDSGVLPSFPYKRPMTKEGYFRKYEYIYDEHNDIYICPEGIEL